MYSIVITSLRLLWTAVLSVQFTRKGCLRFSEIIECRCVDDVVTCSGTGALAYNYIRSSGFYPGYTTAKITTGITDLEASCFKFCWALSSVSLPMGLLTIGNEAFGSCNITSITIPSSVTSISGSAFNDCRYLENIFTTDNTGVYTSVDGLLYYKSTTLAAIGGGRARGEELVIPGVDTLGNSCGRYNRAAIVTISEGVVKIDRSALFKSSMHTLSLPSTVSDIDLSAIAGCANLVNLSLNESNPYMYMYKDSFCEMFGAVNGAGDPRNILWIAPWSTSITIPTYVSGMTAMVQQCRNLTSITSQSSYIKVSSSALILTTEVGDSWCYGYYAAGSLVNVVIGSDMTGIGSSCFQDCALLETVKLHKGIIDIGTSVFRGCVRLKSIDFNGCDGFTALPEMMFEDCTSLTTILNWPSADHDVGACTFRRVGFVSLSVPSGVVTIKQRAFIECMDLETLTLPASVKVIEEQAFYSCPKLSSVTFNSNSVLTTIESFAFGCCELLTSVVLPYTLTSLDPLTFGGDWDMAAINFNKNTGIYRSEGVVYKKVGTNNYHTVVLAPPCISGTVSLRTVTSVISASAFHHCENIVSINLGTSITRIETNAFSLCKRLQTVTFGGALEYIGRSAFFGANLTVFKYCGTRNDIDYEDDDPFPTGPNIYTHVNMEGELFCGHLYSPLLLDSCEFKPTTSFTAIPVEESSGFEIKSLQFYYIFLL